MGKGLRHDSKTCRTVCIAATIIRNRYDGYTFPKGMAEVDRSAYLL
jgi:hypothetical protein